MTEGKIRGLGWAMLLVAMVAAGAAIYGNRLLLIERAYQAGLVAIEAEDYQGALDAVAPLQDQRIAMIEHVRALAYLKSSPPLQDIELGLSLQRAAAARGLMRARYFLAAYLLDQDEPSQADIDEALPHLRAAADCGMPAANFLYGRVFEEGRFVEEDMDRAIVYITRAAYTGWKPAVERLTMLYGRRVLSEEEVVSHLYFDGIVWMYIGTQFGIDSSIQGWKAMLDFYQSHKNEDGYQESQAFVRNVVSAGNRRMEHIHPTNLLSCN